MYRWPNSSKPFAPKALRASSPSAAPALTGPATAPGIGSSSVSTRDSSRCWRMNHRKRRFAVPRCWSRRDSNCRSHPTKSLVSRRIGTDFLEPQTLSCEVRPLGFRSASLVERGFKRRSCLLSGLGGRGGGVPPGGPGMRARKPRNIDAAD
jgi:hypothetical protein